MKWIAPLAAYFAVGFGALYLHSAWGTLLGFHAVIFVSLWIAKPGIPISILFKSKNFKWILLSVLLCGSSGVIVYFLRNVFGFAGDFSAQVAALGLNKSNWPFFIVYFTLVNPLLEEYFWRGYLGEKTKSPHLSDFVFAGYHAMILFNKVRAGSILFGLCMLLFAGWMWRQIMRENDGLLAPVLGHMAADFTVLLAVYFMVN